MNIQLSDHFTYKKLIRFVFPSIMMMVFTSIYSMVDGFFISNFVGKTPFAAINLIYPFIMLFGALGFMFGTGGSALVAKTLGEGKERLANEYFSLFIYTALVIGAISSFVGILFIEPVSLLFGADEQMLPYCIIYGRIILFATPAFILQNMFQSFLIAAEKPQFGFFITVLAGVTNMVLDALFVAVFQWGIAGAAFATAFSQFVGGVVPLIYFARKNSSKLYLCKTKVMPRALLKGCSNGMSELVSNISMSFVSILFNFQLMRLAGEDGVAAYGVVMYVSFIFIGIFFGYSLGVAPIISYHFGAKNTDELKNVFRKSLLLIGGSGILLTILAVILAGPLAKIYVGYDAKLLEMTVRAFILYSVTYLFSGFSIYGSSFFTALNDGVTSAIISVLRTVVLQVLAVLILPMIFKLDGIWCSVAVAELGAMLVTIYFVNKKKNVYGYS